MLAVFLVGVFGVGYVWFIHWGVNALLACPTFAEQLREELHRNDKHRNR